MIDHVLLQPEGVIPVEGAGGILPQAIGFQNDHTFPGSQFLQTGSSSLASDFVDDHPPPPPPK